MLKNNRLVSYGLAFMAGLILAMMIYFNGSLAMNVHPYWASTIVHGIGFFFGMILFALFPFARSDKKSVKNNLPWWNFMGGISGGLTVVLASITINSSLGVSGSIAFMLLGQILFALFCDLFGFLGIPKRKLEKRTYIQIFFVSLGCALILMSNYEL